MSGPELVMPVIESIIMAGKAVGKVIQIRELDFDAFKEIVRRADKDVKYSEYCRKAMPPSFYQHPELDAWVYDTISQTKDALVEFQKSFPKTPKDAGKPNISDRAVYTLISVGDCFEREKALRSCHSTLLTGIAVMHQHGLVPRSKAAGNRPKASSMPPGPMPLR